MLLGVPEDIRLTQTLCDTTEKLHFMAYNCFIRRILYVIRRTNRSLFDSYYYLLILHSLCVLIGVQDKHATKFCFDYLFL